MLHQLIFILFLFFTTMTHAMNNITKDIILYHIAPRLDRQDKNSLKSTHKQLYRFVIRQNILNKHYQEAYINNNKQEMNKWREKGALFLDEETYLLFLNKKQKIAKNILPACTEKIGNNRWDLFAVFFYGIAKNNQDYILWLLNTKKPTYDAVLLEKAINHANYLQYTDIVDQLELYIKINTPKPYQRPTDNLAWRGYMLPLYIDYITSNTYNKNPFLKKMYDF